MPLTETDICNGALDRLGADPIASLDQASTNAARLKRQYPKTRDAVLRAYPWNCAQERASLAADATAPAFGYARQFALPEDPLCLRVLAIDGEVDFGLKYKVERRFIRTDEAAPLKTLYIARVAEFEFDPLLSDAISARLAADLAYAITGSASLMEAAAKRYRDILVEARQVDAQEGSPDALLAGEWVESRF
jgi:hypothetical protein